MVLPCVQGVLGSVSLCCARVENVGLLGKQGCDVIHPISGTDAPVSMVSPARRDRASKMHSTPCTPRSARSAVWAAARRCHRHGRAGGSVCPRGEGVGKAWNGGVADACADPDVCSDGFQRILCSRPSTLRLCPPPLLLRGTRYDLLSPLARLHVELLHAMGNVEAEVACLLSAAVAARKHGNLAPAAALLRRLGDRLSAAEQCATEAGVQGWGNASTHVRLLHLARSPVAAWRVEGAKILWAQGQSDPALSLLQGLLAQRASQPAVLPRSGATAAMSSATTETESALEYAYAQCLCAKWLADVRTESSSRVLERMRRAVDALPEGDVDAASLGDQVIATRTVYRLAQFADKLYRGVVVRGWGWVCCGGEVDEVRGADMGAACRARAWRKGKMERGVAALGP